MFKATVVASETYNTALEHHLRDILGVRFGERADADPGLRPIREIVRVDPALNRRWSARRASIESRRGELAQQFQRDHGRPPTPVEMLHLAQQATLETRSAKHEPRTLTEQRACWRAEAARVLGGPQAVDAMVQAALHPSNKISPTIDTDWIARHTQIPVETRMSPAAFCYRLTELARASNRLSDELALKFFTHADSRSVLSLVKMCGSLRASRCVITCRWVRAWCCNPVP